MASLDRHKSGIYRMRFRFGGRQWYRSLETEDEEEASQIKVRIERTLRLVRSGDVALPPGASAEQVWCFFRSGGRMTDIEEVQAEITLTEAIDRYFNDIPDGAKEEGTLTTEKIHAGHLRRILGSGTPLRAVVDIDILQKYVNQRCRTVAPYTCWKELGTLRQVCGYARLRGLIDEAFPSKRGLKFPKSPDKQPFQTFEQIKRAIKNGADEDLWASLFLRESEVVEVLQYVGEQATHAFIPPMVALAALGLRRSEILRAEVADVDLERGVILVREKKRVKSSSLSFRRVDIPPAPAPFTEIFSNWIRQHPGGKYLICKTANDPLTTDAARGYLQRTLRTQPTSSKHKKSVAKNSCTKKQPPRKVVHAKWSKIRGFHIFRHSFASICAMKGIHPSIIDAWLGHQTEAMRKRYRHLFPEETQAARFAIFNGTGS